MGDDKSKRDSQDRAKVSGSEPYEVEHLARKHSITPEQAQPLPKKQHSNRAKLDAEAQKLKLKKYRVLL